MKIQQHKFVANNLSLLQNLTRNGFVSTKLLTYYDIYLTYMSTKDSSKMKRYKLVSEIKKTTPQTVRRAVYEMKKYVN